MLELFMKEYSKELAARLLEKLLKVDVKEVKGEGTFKVTATTEGIDRDGEIILVSGWDFVNFMKNPIMLFGHEYRSIKSIIGAVTKITPLEKSIEVEGVFANTEAGQEARRLYDDGILKAVSVGFIPKEREGIVITKAELLELSWVSVPSNPDAVSASKMIKLEKMTVGTEAEESQQKATAKDPQATLVALEKLIEDLSAICRHYKEAYPATVKTEPEAKSGRVLSAKNLALVNDAIAALTKVRDATEPDTGKASEAVTDTLVGIQSLQKALENVIKKAKLAKESV